MSMLQTLSVDLPDTIDLVLLDGAKAALYAEILNLRTASTGQGACRTADSATLPS